MPIYKEGVGESFRKITIVQGHMMSEKTKNNDIRSDAAIRYDFAKVIYNLEIDEANRIIKKFNILFAFLVSISVSSIYPLLNKDLGLFINKNTLVMSFCLDFFVSCIIPIFVIAVIVLIFIAGRYITCAVWARKYCAVGDYGDWNDYLDGAHHQEFSNRLEEFIGRLVDCANKNSEHNEQRRAAFAKAIKVLIVASWLVGMEWVIIVLYLLARVFQ